MGNSSTFPGHIGDPYVYVPPTICWVIFWGVVGATLFTSMILKPFWGGIGGAGWLTSPLQKEKLFCPERLCSKKNQPAFPATSQILQLFGTVRVETDDIQNWIIQIDLTVLHFDGTIRNHKEIGHGHLLPSWLQNDVFTPKTPSSCSAWLLHRPHKNDEMMDLHRPAFYRSHSNRSARLNPLDFAES